MDTNVIFLWVNLFRAITNIQVRSSTITIQLFGTVPLQFTDTSSTAIFYVLWVPRPTARPLYAYASSVWTKTPLLFLFLHSLTCGPHTSVSPSTSSHPPVLHRELGPCAAALCGRAAGRRRRIDRAASVSSSLSHSALSSSSSGQSASARAEPPPSSPRPNQPATPRCASIPPTTTFPKPKPRS